MTPVSPLHIAERVVEAILAQKQAITLAPNRPYYRKQLERISAGDPLAPLPPEGDSDD